MLSKIEYDSANNMLESILTESVEEIEITDIIPPINDITDSNKVFKDKLSILFVDMRKSTDLTDELKAKEMVKIYRSFLRVVVQAVRYCGGQSRQFAGDGVMGVFQDDKDSSEDILDTKINPLTSCDKAVRAARYILTLIDYCLNPQLKKHLSDVVIGCGVGVCTGTVMATKAGMRGKEADDTVDNELGIVWVGSTTNYASRFCSLTLPREIFIDKTTYEGISSETDRWQKQTRVKGTKSYSGYITSGYYSSLSDELTIEPIISEETTEADTSFVQSIFDETEKRAMHLVDEVSKKSAELSLALENVKKREQQVAEREKRILARENNQFLFELQCQLETKIGYICDISSEFTYSQIQSMGKDYWNNKINEAKELLDKTGNKTWSHYTLAFSKIYEALQQYDDFYHEICIMAKDGYCVYESDIRIILDKTYLRSTLKDALQSYIDENKYCDTSDDYQRFLKMMGE